MKMNLSKLHKILTKKALYANEKYVPIEVSEACARSIFYRDSEGKRETLLERVEKVMQ